MSSDFKGRKKRSIGFRFAWNGIKEVVRTERNFTIHLVAAFLVILLAAVLQVSFVEWAILILTIALVLSLEMVNSSIERVMDHLASERHPLVGLVKDIAAGAVLVASFGAVGVACFIFLPRIISFFLGE
ncbi:diacylglycerol kinase family protein [Halobacillus fulvus]|nr:diacylglycerol kinase family protein [Halobacillus fulvus]